MNKSLKELYEEVREIKIIPSKVLKSRRMQEWFQNALTIETDECIEWPFSLSYGYGQCGGRINVSNMAHKVAAINRLGPIPIGMEVSHGPCHNRACFNYRHLSYKTHIENNSDKIRDGTNRANVKWTNEQIEEMLRLYFKGQTQAQISTIYGISRQNLSYWINKRKNEQNDLFKL